MGGHFLTYAFILDSSQSAMNEVSGIPRRSWWSTAFRFDSADNRDSFQPNHNLHFSTQPLFVFSTQYTIGFNWPKKQKDSFYHFENRFKDFTNMDQNTIIFVVWQPIWIVGEGLCQLCHQEVLNDELSNACVSHVYWQPYWERSLARMQSLFLCPAATGKLITFPQCMVHVVSILSGMLRASVLPRGENIV